MGRVAGRDQSIYDRNQANCGCRQIARLAFYFLLPFLNVVEPKNSRYVHQVCRTDHVQIDGDYQDCLHFMYGNPYNIQSNSPVEIS